ncbi:MAG: GntR family transcriptional regulator [Chloroflexi bacterium]|nr:GntR family transcriptional regulator [Chloroflexota bacterium]
METQKDTALDKIYIDFQSGVPIYVQLMEQIESLVMGGQLKPGDQMPTVRQLAAELGVNFNTVARAYRLMDEAGIISTQQGRGTYILAPEKLEETQLLKMEVLDWLTQRFFADAAYKGFSLEEIRAAFEKEWSDWMSRRDLAAGADAPQDTSSA